jgi:sugar lactone lactonase YvrE
VQVAAHSSTNYGAVYDTVNKKTVIVVENASDYPTAFNCTVSGTSISVSSGFVITTATTGSGANGHMTAVYDESQSKVVVPQVNTSDIRRGVATVYQPPSSNALPAPKFVAIAQEDIANAASGEVVLVGGIAENATSEVTTTNSTVYLQADGSLSTTVSPIEAGLAFGDTTVTGYYLEGTVYDNVQYSHGNETNPVGLAFKSDGTKFYILGTSQDTVFQYSLSTAWDMSTASYDSVSFSVLAQATLVNGLCFSTDGTKFYVTDNGTDAVYQYTLSTAWDLSTASYASKSMSTQGTGPGDGFMHPSGTKFYTVDFNADVVQEYDLTTAFDISTGSYSQQFSVSSQETVPIAISFNSDGTEMYVAGQSQDTVFQYDLSTAYDISTASYSSISYDLGAQSITSPHGIAWKSDGTKMYIICNGTDKIYQYTTQLITTSKLLLNG